MSESIVRKVQSFTIGTRLSVPAVPKCTGFTQGYLQSKTLDNCSRQHNLNERVTLYLSRSQVRAGASLLPLARRDPPARRQEDMAAEDHLNRNAVSPNTVSRSIRKITISGSKEDRASKAAVGHHRPAIAASPKTENINNNNNITTSNSQLPRIVGVSCENKPSSQFKVLLRQTSCDEKQASPVQEHTSVQGNREETVQQTAGPGARSPQKDQLRRESPSSTLRDGVTVADSQSDCFIHRTSLFSREVLQGDQESPAAPAAAEISPLPASALTVRDIAQAEAWIRAKLQDLKDGGTQHCPLQDRQETLHRDLRDFENTHIQLTQTGQQLTCQLNPSADHIRKQLSQLKDQWQTLKQTADSQSRAVGSARNLQEFNKKVDKLEVWIKEKQEESSLVSLLGGNMDKMQLTRKIMDLKQDEQLYRSLHEEVNHLALQLEKQGKAEGRNISARKKHLNKMWLKIQSNLKDFHEHLQLALEVSSFYQQADNILFDINNMRKSTSKAQESNGDRDVREIASHIMMLDVSASQLSNLHPVLVAHVAHKQTEVKESWALLQKAIRSSTFTREDSDPTTPARELQCTLGIEAHRILGKEVKEEQNRLKGSLAGGGGGVCEGSRRDLICPDEDQRTSSLPGDALAGVITRRPSDWESRKQRGEPRGSGRARGHTQLPHTQLPHQLHKFTLSADKTLSWLKDNVAMAMQVCSLVGEEGVEAARRRQDLLEQEILSNRARIEVVKKEGRGLVLAGHPGSARIQSFLEQLEGLWDELSRRHQRNAAVLLASEELGFRAVKVLQTLGSLEAWLESVELSMRESSLAGDPETMSVAERESRLLEREVAERGLELGALRKEVDRLSGQRHPHTEQLPARMEQLEDKYQRVQTALTQQSSELQDARMLTEFLERVELEEKQAGRGSPASSSEQPLSGELVSTAALLGLQRAGGAPLLQSMGDPVEELREAVEMLNHTVRERGRTQSHNQAVLELLSRHAGVALRVQERVASSRELGEAVLQREADMVVKCEPDHCGLEGLQEEQHQQEIDYKAIKVEVEEMERQGSRLEELCPERVHLLGTEVQATLQAWAELGRNVMENRGRLRQFVHLQDFFRNYLGMISWTEDTRSCIFSDSTLHLGKDGQEPVAAELDLQIQHKFEEFEELAAAGRDLLEAEHHLAETIRERVEELRSMLGWILVHWRTQKQQWERRSRKEKEEESGDNIYSETTVCSPLRPNKAPEADCSQLGVVGEDRQRPSDSHPSLLTSRMDEQQDEEELDDGYEVMNSIGPRCSVVTTLENRSSPALVLRDPGSPALGATVNLILSFANPDGLQHPEASLSRGEESSEPLHRPSAPLPSACKSFWRRCQGLLENTFGSLKRKKKIYRQSADEVSTYLHVKDNHLAVSPLYESITLPHLHGKTHLAASCSSPPPSSSSCPLPPTSSVSFPSLPLGGSSSASLFSSLKRRSKKRKRKRDDRRHTIQRIMGGEGAGEDLARGGESVSYDTQTWPLKEEWRRKAGAKPPGSGAELPDYLRNRLACDIDAEGSGEFSITPYAMSEGTPAPPPQVRSHCRFLSLGSVLTFDLPKDMSLIPSLQDVITIGPPEARRGEGTASHPDRPAALSSFKQGRAPPSVKASQPEESSADCHNTQTVLLLPDVEEALPPPPLREEDQTVQHDDRADGRLRCSGMVSLHEEDQTVQHDDRADGRLRCSGMVSLHEEDQTVQHDDRADGRLRCSGMVSLHEEDQTVQHDDRADGRLRCSGMVSLHEEDQTVQHDDRADGRLRCSGMVSLHEDAEQGWARKAAERDPRKPSPHTSQAERSVPAHQPPAPCPGSLSQGVCILSLSQVSDLASPHSALAGSPRGQCSQASLVVSLTSSSRAAGRDDSVDSGVSSSGSVPRAGTPDDPPPGGVVGRVAALEVGGLDCGKPRMNPASVPASASVEADPIHPDHQQFEEEEEELEEIWTRTPGLRQSICSDIMYQPHQEEDEGQGPPLAAPREPQSPRTQPGLYRKLVTASAPNLLVAEFTLPSSGQRSPRAQPPALGKRDRRSWAAFPDHQQPCKPSALVNETAADPVKLPDIQDQKRYIYQYKEEEEEEEEEDTGCLKEQVSLLSGHMTGVRTAQTSQPSQDHDAEEQEQRLTTGGRCNVTKGLGAELLSMEGPLERKQQLQLGGRRASSRAWGSLHAVLHRQTLCFYQDRKDLLRSCVCGLPLNLAGAQCAAAPEYSKKPNCFSLRLRDGSEYLFSASSHFLMRKWMMKIQANTGRCDPVTSVSSPGGPAPPAPPTSHCHCPARHDLTSSLPRAAPIGSVRTKEIVVLTRESGAVLGPPGWQGALSPRSHAGRDEDHPGSPRKMVTGALCGSPKESSPSSSLSPHFPLSPLSPHSPHSPLSGSHDGPSHKRRSHSFTSATYQKIKPVMLPPGVRGGSCGSCYSVTLLIGDKKTDVQASSAVSPRRLDRQDSPPDPAPRGYASLPRPRNKSVFKKFFGKKD
ncbi:uncharacterized protein [Osmerus mordax]|uniref:uncharacterized protein n=1 Tax=Osmerus mordax TaxID=8014 RepID=UPI00350FFEAB